jgi:predicted regulator of Ras-like GTPase activity (Roadblock/LC7/MglB family)
VQVAVVAGDPKDDEAKGFLVVDADGVVVNFDSPTLRDVDRKAMKQVGDFATSDQVPQRGLLR